MKFCKDCVHYEPPQAAMAYGCFAFVPATCRFDRGEFNPVTGEKKMFAGYPEVLRAPGQDCGPDAVWFKPANLDGRLAMLPEAE